VEKGQEEEGGREEVRGVAPQPPCQWRCAASSFGLSCFPFFTGSFIRVIPGLAGLSRVLPVFYPGCPGSCRVFYPGYPRSCRVFYPGNSAGR
jgi:hypothetical protein